MSLLTLLLCIMQSSALVCDFTEHNNDNINNNNILYTVTKEREEANNSKLYELVVLVDGGLPLAICVPLASCLLSLVYYNTIQIRNHKIVQLIPRTRRESNQFLLRGLYYSGNLFAPCALFLFRMFGLVLLRRYSEDGKLNQL